MRLLFVTVIVGLAISCAPKTYSPDLKKLYNTNSLVNVIGLVQDAAIGLEQQKRLTTGEARYVVQFTVDSLHLIQDQPKGWKEYIVKTMTDIRHYGILPSVKEKLEPLFVLIEKIIGELK